MTFRQLAALGLTALLVACAAPALPSTIDGYVLGNPVACASSCSQSQAIARAHLDSQHPGHAAVTAERIFDEVLPVGTKRSGSILIWVFDLADGSRAAVGVYCGVTGCIAIGPTPLASSLP